MVKCGGNLCVAWSGKRWKTVDKEARGCVSREKCSEFPSRDFTTNETLFLPFIHRAWFSIIVIVAFAITMFAEDSLCALWFCYIYKKKEKEKETREKNGINQTSDRCVAAFIVLSNVLLASRVPLRLYLLHKYIQKPEGEVSSLN